MRSPLMGRLVTSPIAFLLGAVAELVVYALGSLRSTRRRVN